MCVNVVCLIHFLLTNTTLLFLYRHQFLTVHISEPCGQLLQWMLQPNPKDRPTLSQVMLHEWVVDGDIEPPVPPDF